MEAEDFFNSNGVDEIKRPCPNCGVLHKDSELNYSASNRIEVGNGVYAGTLYGVCSSCAEVYGSQSRSVESNDPVDEP